LSLKERIHFLTTPEQVDSFLASNPDAAIFKAGTCHKTQETFGHVQSHLEAQGGLPLGIIRVVEARPASNRVTELTGITHESPQFFLFKGGKAVFDRDNWDITDEDVAAGLGEHFPRVGAPAS